MKRHGTSLLEVLFVVAGMLVMLVPILLLLGHGQREAKISADEFQAALLLSELADQVALLRLDELPAEEGIRSLEAPGRHVLREDRPGAWLELSPLPAPFERRELVLEPAASAAAGRAVRMIVGYRRPRGPLKTVETLTFVYPAMPRARE